jgi:quinol monooxygenase YgiN
MHRLTISRLIVDDSAVPEWEEAIEKQVEICSTEPGTLLYGFCRRGTEGTPMLPQPKPGTTEYVQIHGYKDAEAFSAHVAAEAEWWKPTSERLAPPTSRFSERLDDSLFGALVSRDHSWRPDTMLNLGILRFKVPFAGAEAFETDARRQIEMVTENELGTVLYAFIRRTHAASALLPRPVETMGANPGPVNAEYLSFSAYTDADARKLHGEIEHRGEQHLAGDHFTFEGDWAWGTAYRSHLASPLESEGFPAAQIVAVTSKFSTS